MSDSMNRLRQDFRTAFGSETGRRVLDDLRSFCHFDRPTYQRGDQFETAFREGRRSVFLRIMALTAEPPKLQEEAIGDESQ